MDVERQAADTIVNVEYHHERQRDHRRTGIALLRDRHYAAAARVLGRAVEESPTDAEAHYHLALALLGGLRPHRHPRPVLDDVRRHLETARTLPEAEVLRVLVDEDDELLWRRYTAVPQALVDRIARVHPRRAAEIVRHVPAHGARTFRLLEARGRS